MTRYWMTDGINDLNVMVDDSADLDGAFDAICCDTGETLRVKGWMIEEIEKIDEPQLTEA